MRDAIDREPRGSGHAGDWAGVSARSPVGSSDGARIDLWPFRALPAGTIRRLLVLVMVVAAVALAALVLIVASGHGSANGDSLPWVSAATGSASGG